MTRESPLECFRRSDTPVTGLEHKEGLKYCMHVCVCVCACVCERERERERVLVCVRVGMGVGVRM